MAIRFNPFTNNFDFAGSSSGSLSDSFVIMQPDSGTAPTAASSADTLTFHNTDGNIAISGNATTKTLGFDLNTIPIGKGGTGQTSANAALNALLPSQGSAAGKVLSSNGTNSSWAYPVGALTNLYYIDKNGNDSTGTGSISAPYLTISKALTVIGAAANSSDYNDATQMFYSISVGPGVYTENLSVPTRPVIILNLTCAQVVGNLTQNFDQNVIGAGTLQQSKLLVYGQDLRSSYNLSSNPISGINGNIVIQSITGGSGLTSQLHLLNTGCTGNITMQKGSGGGTFTGQVHLSNAIVAGTIQTSGTPGSITLYASNIDTSASYAIGGITGAVNLYVLRNVRFLGPVVTSGGGSRWFGVDFKASTAHDFTGSTATVVADANSIDNFKANVPTPGSMTFTYADTARGVGYTPAVSGNWSVVPSQVAGALDTLAAALSSGGVTSIGTFDSQAAAANALTIVGTTLYGQSASATNPGMVNTAAQTFAGAKTFKASMLWAGATSGAITHSFPATITSHSLSWPNAQGGASSVLQNDGSGNLSWGTIAVSGVTTVGTYDSQASAANGLVISGSSVYAQSATASNPGMVSTGTQTFAGTKTITGALIKGNYHMEPSEYNAGNSGASLTIDMSQGAVVLVTLNAATPALTLSNPQAGAPYLIKIAQDGTGSRVPTWSTTIDWGALGAPTLSTTASKVDYLQLVYSGSGWRGMSYALGYNA